MGEVQTDVELAQYLAGTIVDFDEIAHKYEHSIEVQIPFLQHRFGEDFKILPICMGLQDEETASEVGAEIARAVEESGRKVAIIASSDFTHYQPADIAREIDDYLIGSILDMNVPELFGRIYEKGATACGYGPIAAMLTASKALGATKASLLKYATSGDVTGDDSAVVGYAAIVVE
jgi:AmmeMemoRadiSam system protein B